MNYLTRCENTGFKGFSQGWVPFVYLWVLVVVDSVLRIYLLPQCLFLCSCFLTPRLSLHLNIIFHSNNNCLFSFKASINEGIGYLILTSLDRNVKDTRSMSLIRGTALQLLILTFSCFFSVCGAVRGWVHWPDGCLDTFCVAWGKDIYPSGHKIQFNVESTLN